MSDNRVIASTPLPYAAFAPSQFDAATIARVHIALAPLAIWFRLPANIEGLDVHAEQDWWIYSKTQLPRQETLYSLLGLSVDDFLAIRAGHGKLSEPELLPDYCLGCGTLRGGATGVEGGRLRYACTQCPPYAVKLEPRVVRHQRLSMMAICAGYDIAVMEWLYLHFIAKSWMFDSHAIPGKGE